MTYRYLNKISGVTKENINADPYEVLPSVLAHCMKRLEHLLEDEENAKDYSAMNQELVEEKKVQDNNKQLDAENATQNKEEGSAEEEGEDESGESDEESED